MRSLLDSVAADLHFALRSLRRQPTFALVAILTLAVGIGAATMVFSVVEGALLRPLPYPQADRIVHLGLSDIATPGPGTNTSVDDYVDWARESRSFGALGVMINASPTLTGRGDPERVGVAQVSSGLFRVFHVRPYLGRRLGAGDDARGAAPVALLAYDFWRSRFGGDRSIVGRSIELSSRPVEVVGVLPPGFAGPGRLNRPIWQNFTAWGDGRANLSESVWALLAPGVTLERARAEMAEIGARLARTYVEDRDRTVAVSPLRTLLLGDLARPLYTFLAASLLVLLIACANVSNLLLARGLARHQELGVRAALGAPRARLLRQLLTESALLAAVGGLAGILVAGSATSLLVRFGPLALGERPPELDLRVLAATVALAACATLFAGLVPALRAAPGQPQLALRDSGARAGGGRGGRIRMGLAVVQLSSAVVLLCAGGLVARSLVRVLRVEPGISPDHLLALDVSLPQDPRYDGLSSTLFFRELVARVAGLPGVRAVASTNLVPFSGDEALLPISRILGEPERQGDAVLLADRYMVSPTYFQTLGIRLLRGRALQGTDRFDDPLVCVVDTVFARRAFGSGDPVGRSIQVFGRPGYARIVGEVAHVKSYGLDAESLGQVYVSTEQFPWRWSSLVVRTSGDPLRSAPAIVRAVHALDPEQPVSDVATMDALMADLLRGRRFALSLLGIFAAVATALAAVGLYGVIAYGVSRRRREFSLRLALGARRGQLARMVLADAARIAVVGLVLGIPAALAAGRLIAAMLFQVSPRDATVLAGVSLALAAVACLASLLPARGAMAVDPAEALRAD